MKGAPKVLQPIGKKAAPSVGQLYIQAYTQARAELKQLRQLVFQQLAPPHEATRVWAFAGDTLSEKAKLPQVKSVGQLVDHLQLEGKALQLAGEQFHLDGTDGRYVFLASKAGRAAQSAVGFEFQRHIVYGLFGAGAREQAERLAQQLEAQGLRLEYDDEARRRRDAQRELVLAYEGAERFTLGPARGERLAYSLTRRPGGAEHSTYQRTLLVFLGGDALRAETQLAAQISQRVPQVFTAVHAAGDPARYHFGAQLNLFRPAGRLLPAAALEERLRAAGRLLAEFGADGRFIRLHEGLAAAHAALAREFFRRPPRVPADAVFQPQAAGVLYRNVLARPLRPGRAAPRALLAVLGRGAPPAALERLAAYQRAHADTAVYLCVRRMAPLVAPTLLRRVPGCRALGLLLDERCQLAAEEHGAALYDADGVLLAAGPSVDEMAAVRAGAGEWECDGVGEGAEEAG